MCINNCVFAVLTELFVSVTFEFIYRTLLSLPVELSFPVRAITISGYRF